MNQNKNVNSDSAFKDIFSRVSDNPQDKTVQSSKKEFEPKAQDTEKKPIEKNQVSESKSSNKPKEDNKEISKGNENKEQIVKEDRPSEKTESNSNVNEDISNEGIKPEEIKQEEILETDIDPKLLEIIASILKSLTGDTEPVKQIDNEKLSQIVQDIKAVLENNQEVLSQISQDDIKPDKILKMLSEAGIDINKLAEDIKDAANLNPKPLNDETIKPSRQKNQSKEDVISIRKELTLGNDLKAQLLSLKVDTLSQEKMMLSDELKEEMMGFGLLNNDSEESLNISDIKFSTIGLKASDSIGNTGIKDARPMQIINKIAQEIKSIIGKEKSEINIKLEPESLGKLSVKISSENGVFNASFYAENDRAKAMIESNIASLKKTLEEQGLQINELNVFVGSNPDDLNRHKNIMEAQKYSKLRSDSSIGIENVLEDISTPLNPYMIDDIFSDLI